MIAISYPSWEEGVTQLSRRFGDIGIKLYSFEIKKSLSFANLREAFFQAVSNSSWSQEGYLVAAELSSDEDFSGGGTATFCSVRNWDSLYIARRSGCIADIITRKRA